MFANGTAGARYVSADGTWLNVPDAALIGNANNSNADQDTAVLLTLSNPMYDAATQVRAYLPQCIFTCAPTVLCVCLMGRGGEGVLQLRV